MNDLNNSDLIEVFELLKSFVRNLEDKKGEIDSD